MPSCSPSIQCLLPMDSIARWLKEYGIERWRVVYREHEKNYCKECNDQVTYFSQQYGHELNGCTFIYDAGNAWKIGGEHVLHEFAKAIHVLKPLSHGMVSPLDNKVNARVKAKWRAECPHDDVDKASLHLLSCFDWEEEASIVKDWHCNFFLNARGPVKMSLEAVEDLVRGRRSDPALVVEREAKYLESYMEWKEDNVEQVPSNDPVQLQAQLDGSGAQLKKRRR
jgi:hypothetical protein